MTCREALDFLMNYIDGELAPDVRATFDRHLDACASCRAYLANYQQTVRAGKAAFAADSDDQASEMPEELIRAMIAALKPL